MNLEPEVDRRSLARGLGLPAAMALAILGFALLGFFPTYFGRIPRFEGVSVTIHLHVLTLLVWLALFVAQTVLVHRGRTDLHRRLGRLALAWLPVVAVGMVLAMNEGQRRHKNPDLILATLFDAALFFSLVGLAWWHRRRPSHHRGYMLLALAPFLNPTLGRVFSPQASLPIELAFMVGLLLLARRRREPTRPYWVGLALFIAALGALAMVLIGFPDLPERLWTALYGS